MMAFIVNFVSIPSFIFHFIFRLTACPTILSWEFKFARFIHLHQRVIAVVIILMFLCANTFILLFVPSLCHFSYFAVSLSIGHGLYCIHSFDHFHGCLDRMTQTGIYLMNFIIALIEKFTRICFQNAFKFNADSLHKQLTNEIAACSSISSLSLSLPVCITHIITGYAFHGAIKALSSEQMMKKMLKSIWQCIDLIIQTLVDFVASSNGQNISFQINYGDGLGGCLNGMVVVGDDDDGKRGGLNRSIPLNIKYGKGEGKKRSGICLEYDVASKQIFDLQQNEAVKCQKMIIPFV